MLQAFRGAEKCPRGEGQQRPSSTLFYLQVALGKTQHPKKTADINYCLPTAKKKQGRNSERDTGT